MHGAMEVASRRPAMIALIAIGAILALALSQAAPASARGCGGADESPGALGPGEARDAVVCLVNREREQAGVGALKADRRLQRAAQGHSELMDRSGCFDHTCGGEGDLDRRLPRVGYLAG